MQPKEELSAEAKATKAHLIDLSELSDPITKQMLQYWVDKRGSRLMPSPADMNFADFARYASKITLIEVAGDAAMTVRLAGEEVIGSLGFNPRGRELRTFDEELRGLGALLHGFYSWLLTERRPAAVRGTQYMLGKSYVSYEAIYLPLSSDGENIDRFMDVTVTYLRSMNVQRRFAALDARGPAPKV